MNFKSLLFVFFAMNTLITLGQTATPEITLGRYDAVGSPVCSNGTYGDFKHAAALEDGTFVPMHKASKMAPPTFWILEYKGKLALGLGAAVLIDHWDCPDDGDSILVHAHYSYLSVFEVKHSALPFGDYNLLGSYASNYYKTHTPYLANELEQNINDEITFHMKPEINGAIERFRYYGPTKTPAIRVLKKLDGDKIQVEFDGVCGQGHPPMTVEYQRAHL